MIKEILSNINNVSYAIAAMIIFGTTFAGFTFWTLKKENKLRYEEAGSLPLNDGETHEQR